MNLFQDSRLLFYFSVQDIYYEVKSLNCRSHSERAGIVAYNSRFHYIVYVGKKYELYPSLIGSMVYFYDHRPQRSDFDSDRWDRDFDRNLTPSAFESLVYRNSQASNEDVEKHVHLFSQALIGSYTKCVGTSFTFHYSDEEVKLTFPSDLGCYYFTQVLRDAGFTLEN